ncbi:pirin family protein [Chitinophaga rhizophila]|uniref:Pirin family protein n=1 Tax=Chitinophaga rhizophila TaxID=2866212 RepID=A0ABS7GAP9_9BACT|nr:pirin family protein [Chitinophaga rhizophila]MBW8684746.1 pirin family protein [Chitinophaga rhizophila]
MNKKRSSFSSQGRRADIGDLEIYRILPNRYAEAVGPFVFLDHVAPRVQAKVNTTGTGAHPHRGIATLTYILNGEDEHFDSAGNYAMVHSGGVQWMNAGNGIIHDETLNYDSHTDSRITHAFQFWINLPSAIKAQQPAYFAMEGNEVPIKDLPDGNGWIKVITGSFQELKSPIPVYSEQFLYHIHLNAGAVFTISFSDNAEVAAYLPVHPAILNDESFGPGDFIEFDRNTGIITISNNNNYESDIILFGGERYEEPIVAEGPFVMNSDVEIAKAYKDFYSGAYGKIDYDKQRAKSSSESA